MIDRLLALETFGIKLGLENISRLCAALGHPERTFTSLHIAGTNGKGSVAAMAHAALVAAGHRAARYTSPHLADITERFVVGNAAVSMETLEGVAAKVLDTADAMLARGELRAPPTFFEATTATAFEIFRQAGVAVAVIEVGLGGRFDATNVIDAPLGAITTIGFDHQQHLGHTLGAIAFEKAGIVKPGMTVVTGALPAEADETVRRVAAERGARIVRAFDDVSVTTTMEDGAARMAVATPRRSYGPLVLGLGGAHQVSNAVVAVRLLEEAEARGIAVPAEAVVHGLERPSWAARLERFVLEGGRRVLLDAAHNVDGAAALADYLRQWHPQRPTLVLGIMRDKAAEPMLRLLLPVVSRLVATAAPTPRAIPAQELAARAAAVVASLPHGTVDPHLPIAACADPVEAVRAAVEASPDVCVAGSIFLAGAVRPELERRAILPR